MERVINYLCAAMGGGFKSPAVSVCVRKLAYMSSFFEQVYEIVAKIPYGKVISYGQIAHMTGNPRAARTVGWALSSCPDELPWHRVVMADGNITGGEFAETRRAMLEEEGIKFVSSNRVDMDQHAWDGRTG